MSPKKKNKTKGLLQTYLLPVKDLKGVSGEKLILHTKPFKD